MTATSAPTSTAPGDSPAGATLSEVTAEVAAGWGIAARLLPATDDRLRTLVTIADEDGGETEVDFQTYFVRRHHDVPVRSVRFDGAAEAGPRPGCSTRSAAADAVVVAPSNPVVSIGPVLAVPASRRRSSGSEPGRRHLADRRRRRARRARPTACSPSSATSRRSSASPASTHRCAPRSSIDDADAALAAAVEAEGIGCVVTNTIMRDPPRSRPSSPATCSRRWRHDDGLSILAIPGMPEIRPGDDLAGLVVQAAAADAATALADGDVVVVTQKVVSKAEGKLERLESDDPLAHKAIVERESVRVLRRRGDLVISETKHGFVCANAGVDLSNVDAGWAALLPDDADRSARRLRDGIRARAGVEVAVIVSDTFGRPWRRGLTDVAIGCAGIGAIVDLRGTTDTPRP